MRGFYRAVKRFLDVTASFLGLVLLSPLMLAVSILIKIDSRGPVIFRQKRIGRNGKVFEIYKFRSMCVGAEKTGSGVYSGKGDARVTRIGKILRATSIDELPQFLNILKGDMAFIGPRPLLRDEVEMYYPQNKDILLSLKPGLTGYWQAYARNNVTYESGERQRMELYYIEHSDWTMDIKILFRTVKIVLSGDGAQ